MAALPGAQLSKGYFVLWLEMTKLMLDMSLIASTDTIGASESAGARQKVALERDAH